MQSEIRSLEEQEKDNVEKQQADDTTSNHSTAGSEDKNPKDVNLQETGDVSDNDSDGGSSTSTESLVERSKKYLTDEAGIIILKQRKEPKQKFDIRLNFDVDNNVQNGNQLKYKVDTLDKVSVSENQESKSGEEGKLLTDGQEFTWKALTGIKDGQASAIVQPVNVVQVTNSQDLSQSLQSQIRNIDAISSVISTSLQSGSAVTDKEIIYEQNFGGYSTDYSNLPILRNLLPVNDLSIIGDEIFEQETIEGGKLVLYLTEKQLAQLLKQRAIIVAKQQHQQQQQQYQYEHQPQQPPQQQQQYQYEHQPQQQQQQQQQHYHYEHQPQQQQQQYYHYEQQLQQPQQQQQQYYHYEQQPQQQQQVASVSVNQHDSAATYVYDQPVVTNVTTNDYISTYNIVPSASGVKQDLTQYLYQPTHFDTHQVVNPPVTQYIDIAKLVNNNFENTKLVKYKINKGDANKVEALDTLIQSFQDTDTKKWSKLNIETLNGIDEVKKYQIVNDFDGAFGIVDSLVENLKSGKEDWSEINIAATYTIPTLNINLNKRPVLNPVRYEEPKVVNHYYRRDDSKALESLEAFSTKLRRILDDWNHLQQQKSQVVTHVVQKTLPAPVVIRQPVPAPVQQIKSSGQQRIKRTTTRTYFDNYTPSTRVYTLGQYGSDNLTSDHLQESYGGKQSDYISYHDFNKSTVDSYFNSPYVRNLNNTTSVVNSGLSNQDYVQIHPLLTDTTEIRNVSHSEATPNPTLPRVTHPVNIDADGYDKYFEQVSKHFGGLRIIDFPVYVQGLELKHDNPNNDTIKTSSNADFLNRNASASGNLNVQSYNDYVRQVATNADNVHYIRVSGVPEVQVK